MKIIREPKRLVDTSPSFMRRRHICFEHLSIIVELCDRKKISERYALKAVKKNITHEILIS